MDRSKFPQNNLKNQGDILTMYKVPFKKEKNNIQSSTIQSFQKILWTVSARWQLFFMSVLPLIHSSRCFFSFYFYMTVKCVFKYQVQFWGKISEPRNWSRQARHSIEFIAFFISGLFILNVLLSYPVQHVCPALQGDALEHRQHGLPEVVKAGDAPLGSLPFTSAFRTIGTVEYPATGGRVFHHFP